MSTALEIITDAYREGNINGIGVVPNDNQQTEGLRRLNTVISSALGYEIGEGLQDWMVGNTNVQETYNEAPLTESTWTRPPINSRLLLNAQSPQTLFLPQRPSDGSRFAAIDVLGTLATYPVTLDANGLKIEDASSIVLNTDGLNRVWFYRADLSNWMVVADLLIDDDMPFPAEFDDAFITLLAMRLNPRYGRAMDGQTGSWMERSLNLLRARYAQKVNVPADFGVLTPTQLGIDRMYNRVYGGRNGWMM